MSVRDGDPSAPGPLGNRFSRATAVGCLGILGVFALPVFLALPLQEWHLSGWVIQLIAAGVFGAMALGAWLLLRVPSQRQALDNAWHPITRTGRAPLRERPAERGNRRMLLAFVGLGAVALTGYVAASDPHQTALYGAGTALVDVVGVACIVMGVLIATGRLPVPGWAWVRTPIHPPAFPQGIAVALFGAAALGWGLLVAAGAGYGWARAGLALLVVGSVLVTPVAQRWPRISRDQPSDTSRHRGPVRDAKVPRDDVPENDDTR